MMVLGIAGGLDRVHEHKLDSPELYTYDGAAVLVENGAVVAGIEQERLDRIKHSNKIPFDAITYCLKRRGITMGEVDRIAYYVDEADADAALDRMRIRLPAATVPADARTLLRSVLGRGLGVDVDPTKLRFFEHRRTHAASAMHQAGFDEALVAVLDNVGGVYAGRRLADGRVSLDLLGATEPAHSLQRLCQALMPLLGLGLFDEYKGVALAADGDRTRFASALSTLYTLLPDGQYRLHLDRVRDLVPEVRPPDPRSGPGREHFDLAAAVQGAMETIVLHVLRHHRAGAGTGNLCLAGGMAENTSTNGRLLYSGLFDRMFVHPVAYDAGCAIGAALLASEEAGRPSVRTRIESVRWGTEAGGTAGAVRALERWRAVLRVAVPDDLAAHVAERIAEGALVAWVDGRSDFGSRALGSRNVLADPRRSAARARVHAALGRAELYRPLSALILEDELDAWCEVPRGTDPLVLPTVAVRIRDERRKELAAAMQADGCARVQTVSRRQAPRLWELITAVGRRTGTPALLGTSLNRASQPTAETVDDAVAAFLCSDLDHLVVDGAVATTRHDEPDWTALRISLPPYSLMVRTKGLSERAGRTTSDEIRTSFVPMLRRPVSAALGDLLIGLDEATALSALLERSRLDGAGRQRLLGEILALWSDRLVVLHPLEGVDAPAA